jgi:ABC-type transport system involved in multi-copper enzyme maturation permease subunit
MARRGLVWWLAAAVVAVTLIRGLVFPPDPDSWWPGVWSAGLVAIVTILLVAVSAGQELAEGTWRMLIARGVARWRLAAASWLAAVLVGGVLLLGVECLAVVLGVRHELPWAELLRAWLCLWPIVSLTMLLAVLGGNAGLPLILGSLIWGLEQATAMVLSSFAMLGEMGVVGTFWRIVALDGPIAALYRWSVSYNGALWAYQAQPLRMPAGLNVLALDSTRPPGIAGLILAAWTVAGAGLAILILYRREMGSDSPGSARAALKRPVWAGRREAARVRRPALPIATGRGPAVIRVAYGYLLAIGRTSLVKMGAGTMALFVLALWAVARQSGNSDLLFRPMPGAAAPVALSASLLMVGLLAAVMAILAISNELSFGTRRATLARGVTRLQALAGQSLAILTVVGSLLALVLIAVLILGSTLGSPIPVGRALVVLAAGLLLGATYVGAAQVGAAATRSPLGPIVAGLGFLMVDWLAILGPTMSRSPDLARLGRYSLTILAYGLVTGRPMIDQPGAPAPLAPLPTLALLLAAALLSYALAAVVAARRDA